MACFAFCYSLECFQYSTPTCKETVLGTDSTNLNTMNQYFPTFHFLKIFLFNYEVICSYQSAVLLTQSMKWSAKFSGISYCKTCTSNSQTIWPSYCNVSLLLLGRQQWKIYFLVSKVWLLKLVYWFNSDSFCMHHTALTSLVIILLSLLLEMEFLQQEFARYFKELFNLGCIIFSIYYSYVSPVFHCFSFI